MDSIFTPAFSVDSLGLPSMTNMPDDPSAKRSRSVALEILRRDPPGQAMQDRYTQARLGYKNHVYLAINTLMDWMGAAEFSVQEKRAKTDQTGVAVGKSHQSYRRKSFMSTSASSTDWHPVDEDHEAAHLFANPNETQTFGDYIAVRTMCRQLFGISYEWVVKDRGGTPRELYCLLPQYVQAIPISPQYPAGDYLITVPSPMYGLNQAGSFRIDRRDMLVHRMPNPQWPWDGLSPLTAGGEMCDVLSAVIKARKNAMDNGLSISSLIKLMGAGDDEMQRFKANIKDKFSGSDRGEQILVTNADEIDIEPMSTTPDKMAFGESYKDSIGFVMALFGVPPALAGLTDTTSFSALYAAVKQFTTGKLGAELKKVAEFWTKKLIQPTPGWRGLKAVLEVPSIEDDTTRPATLATGMQANAIWVNEYRAALNMSPLDGADCTLAEWTAKVTPQPPVQPGMEQGGGDGGFPSGNPLDVGGNLGDNLDNGGGVQMGDAANSGEDADQFPNELMQHVLQSFGVDPNGQSAENGEAELTAGEDAEMVTKSFGAVFFKAWTRGQSSTGGVTASNGVTTLYGHEAETALAGQDKQAATPPGEQRHNPDLDEAFGVESTAPPNRIADDLDAKMNPKPKPPVATVKESTHKAAAQLDPATVPMAKKVIPFLRKSPPTPQTPQAKKQAENPQDWLPKMLTTYLPIFAAAMSLGKGPASKLLIFGALAALHGLSKKKPEDAEQEELGSDGKPIIRPGAKIARDKRGRPIETDFTPTAMPKRTGPNAGMPTPPANNAGRGSLPGRMGKSFTYASWDGYFATIMREEMAVSHS